MDDSYVVLHPSYTIKPYREGHLWMFDDPKVGLFREGLRQGTPEALIRACEIRGIEPIGFVAAFSVTIFGPMHRLDLIGPLWHGTQYLWANQQMTCWFCPALLRYFAVPPNEIWFQVWAQPASTQLPPLQ